MLSNSFRYRFKDQRTVHLRSKASGKNLRINLNGSVDGKGGTGGWATFTVHQKGKTLIKLQNVGNPKHWLRIVENPKKGSKVKYLLNGLGTGGLACVFQVVNHKDGTVSFQSELFKRKRPKFLHIGVRENGHVKDPWVTGSGDHGRFEVLATAGEKNLLETLKEKEMEIAVTKRVISQVTEDLMKSMPTSPMSPGGECEVIVKEVIVKQPTMFDFQKYLLDASSLKKTKKLGSGTFGSVYKGKWNDEGGGITIAYKKIKLTQKFQPEKHLNEFKIMLKTQYPLVLQVYGYAVSKDERKLFIVMELMEEDLLRFLQRKKKKMTMEQRIDLMIRMARCLHFLHSSDPEIIHRDIKSVNFLLKSDGAELKICDFGIAKFKLSSVAAACEKGGQGTLLWMAPELFNLSSSSSSTSSSMVEYTKMSDVYALAMTFFEVLNGNMPFLHELKKKIVQRNTTSIYRFIKEGKRPQCNKQVPKELVEFLDRCWCNKPSERLSTEEIIKWLKEYKKKLTAARGKMHALYEFAMSNQ